MGVTQEQFAKEAEANKNKPRLKKASDGYFYAKREVQEKLEGRLTALHETLATASARGWDLEQEDLVKEIKIVETVRDTLRNTMLWDTSLGE